ncbi:MAG: glycerophosphoryl diester phosphodiesterase membrane domain-containing protein [Candidatus Eisenbacteria bacterium]
MERIFHCRYCSTALKTQFLEPGEEVLCRTCDQRTPVPEENEETAVAEFAAGTTGNPAGPGATEPPPPLGASRSSAGRRESAALPSTDSRLSIAVALSQTTRSAFERFPLLLGLSVIGYLPWIIHLCYMTFGPGPEDSVQNSISNLLSSLMGPFVSSLLVFAVFQKLRDRNPSFAECLRVGGRRAFTVLLTVMVTTFVTILGYVLVLVPGIYLSILYFVVIPVAVIEGTGVGDSISRSMELTSGHRWWLFRFAFVMILLFTCIVLLPAVFIVSIRGLAEEGLLWKLVSILTLVLMSCMSAILAASMSTVVYRELRKVHGDFDEENLLAVFD